MSFSDFTALVLVDSTVERYQHLIDSVQPQAKVIVLHPDQDGIEQITEILAESHSLESLHLLSHGAAGELRLGSSVLGIEQAEQAAAAIATWSNAFVGQPQILLYGCEVAAGEAGQTFVQRLSQLTDANIAASSTLTGSAALGGDWNLDYAIGEVTAAIAFEPEALASYPSVLSNNLLSESFTGSSVIEQNWLFNRSGEQPFLTAGTTPTAPAGGLPGNPSTPEAAGQGALRLTQALNNQEAYVIYNRALNANQGISVTFDFAAYGGVVGPDGNGADGISFFLIDGTTPLDDSPTTPFIGAFGGALGYAQRNNPATAGLNGAVLGVGFDEFGNFANSEEGRIGGAPGSLLNSGGRVPDAVTVRGRRGSGNGITTGYEYLTSSGSLPGGLDNVATGATRDNSTRRAKVDVSPTGVLTVKVDLNNDGDFLDDREVAIDQFNTGTQNGSLPSTFKFGFASSTGDFTNIHEVRNLEIFDLTPGVIFSGAGITRGTDGVARLSTTEGGSATPLRVRLGTRPTSTVSLTLNIANPGTDEGRLSATTLTFTPDNWDSAQTVALTPLDDPTRDGNITYNLQTTSTSTDPTYNRSTPATAVVVTNVDNETGPLPTPGPSPTPTPTPTPEPAPSSDDDRNCRPGRTIRRGSGNQTINGTTNSDRLFGGAGNDVIRGRRCNDLIDGGTGNDRLFGDTGRDRIRGGSGNDQINGGRASDTLDGGAGSDRIAAGEGNDFARGGTGRDRVNGDSGDDIVNGGAQNDIVIGGLGNDLVIGAAGDDRLFGGAGDDRLIGALGRDRLNGGGGRDRFIYRRANEGNDRIDRFEVANDVIDVRQLFRGTPLESLSASDRFTQGIRLRAAAGGSTTVFVDTNGAAARGLVNIATINAIAPASLTAANFLLA